MGGGDSPPQETVVVTEEGFSERQKYLSCFDQALSTRQEGGPYPGADYPLLSGQAQRSQDPRTPGDLDVQRDSAGPLCSCVLGSDELGRTQR